MTRRELLAASAASAATLWARVHWDRSRISAITDEIGLTAEDAADFAKKQGLLFVEVRNQPGSNREYAAGREADAKAAATYLTITNIKVSVVNTGLLKFPWPGQPNADQARWDGRMDEFHKALRCAQIMGADKVSVTAGSRAGDPAATFPKLADTLDEMAAEAERQKITLLLANHPATNVATCADLAAVMKLVPSKWVGINWAPALEGYALLPKKRILNVRVPAASLAMGKPESMNWKNILLALDKDAYAGRITLETGLTGKSGISAASDSLDELIHIVREVE